jgi:hypothetical protein
MLKIRPVILIGIGPQSQQTLRSYMENVRIRQGNVPAILPVILTFSSVGSPFRRTSKGVQYLTLSSPVFEDADEWFTWLPSELEDISQSERERTRAWMRAALLQQADDLQEFLLESIPHLSSFAAVEELAKMDLSLVGDSEIGVYVIADLNDQLGSGVFVDVSYLTYYVCRQLGLHPSTTGLFYLPSATSPAPAEEAIAYAAFKELDHYFSTRSYDGEFVPDWATTEEVVPFNDGCYLLDNVNELGYTLEDPAQQISATGEWLYAMTLLDMRTSIRKHRRRRYYNATLRGKSRAYESFGMAIRYVPQVPLMDWCAARLGQGIIDRILNAPGNGNPEKNARAFLARMGLGVDALGGRLRQQAEPQQVESALKTLNQSGFGQIESQARHVLQNIRERHLPALDQSLSDVVLQAQQEIRQAVDEEVTITLQDTALGGIPSAWRFLRVLREHLSVLQEEAEELAKKHRVELRQSLSTISKTHYTLRSVVMSIPPWPISALSVVSLVILPLVYETQLIAKVIRSTDQNWGFAALVILLAGILGVLGFVAFRLWRQKRLVSEQHKRMIRERFELEGKPLLTRAIRTVYSTTQDAIEQVEQELAPLVSQLEATASHFEHQAKQSMRDLSELATPGPFRSVVGPEQAEQFFVRNVPDGDQFVSAVTQQLGTIVDWQSQSSSSGQSLSAWLGDQLSHVGSQYLQQRVRRLDVLDMMSSQGSQSRTYRDLQQMFESARPLWNYDPRVLRRAKTQRMTLLGVDTSGPAWVDTVGPLSKLHPDVIPIDTGDPFTVAALCVHRGLPLFALRRIGEYRAHYAEMLWHSKLPVHTMRTFALTDDLIPTRQRTNLPAVALFAVGLALGSVTCDSNGRYAAPRARAQAIRLSTDKERSVALMSMNSAACREVQRQLDEVIATKGKQAIRTILDEYMTVMPSLEDWEVKSILDFARSYQLGMAGV